MPRGREFPKHDDDILVDYFPARVYVDRPDRSGHPGYNRSRVLVLADRRAFVINEQGEITERLTAVGQLDQTEPYLWTGPDGASLTWSPGKGCNCKSLDSRVTRDRIREGELS